MSTTSIHRIIPTNEFLAILNSNSATALNPFATIADLVAAAFTLPTSLNYSTLPLATSVPNKIYNVLNPQGSKWRPVWLGGSDYYPPGIYQSIAGVWEYIGEFPYQSTQMQVDAGTDNETFVTPLTLANASKWNTKENTLTAGTNITIDRTNPLAPIISSGGSSSSLTPIKQNTSDVLTGTTSETIITSILIHSGTFQGNDWLEFLSSINASNNANAKTIRAYFNTSPSLSGATLWGIRNLGAAVSQQFGRNLFFKNSITSQRTLVGTTINLAVDSEGGSTGTAVDLSINFAVDQYFIISGQLAVGTDTITINGITSLIRR